MARIAIVGSRTYKNLKAIWTFVAGLKRGDVVVSGGAEGVDREAVKAAGGRNLQTQIFLPDWDTHGKAAGPLRNEKIVNNSDYVVAFWDGVSRGTLSTITYAAKQGKRVVIFGDKDD